MRFRLETIGRRWHWRGPPEHLAEIVAVVEEIVLGCGEHHRSDMSPVREQVRLGARGTIG